MGLCLVSASVYVSTISFRCRAVGNIFRHIIGRQFEATLAVIERNYRITTVFRGPLNALRSRFLMRCILKEDFSTRARIYSGICC